MIALFTTLFIGAAMGSQAPCTVLDGGTVLLMDGPSTDTQILVAEGSIQELGPSVETVWKGQACETLELAAQEWVTPGLVHVGGTLGLQEVWGESATHQHDAGGDPVRAAHDVGDSYDPLSVAVPVARREGITAAVVVPDGGIVAGQAAWVQLAGASQAEAVQKRGVAMRASLGGGSPAEGIRLLTELLEDARAYRADPRAYDQNRSRGLAAGRMELEALQPVLDREMPLLVGANRAATIEALIRFAEAQRVRLIIDGGAEAWLQAEALAEAGIPVLLNPLRQDPVGFDQLHARPDNPALLAQAGVPLIITNHSALFASHLRQLAGLCVRAGMEHDEALRAITITPAEVFGMADTGRIAPGASADLVLWNGDPLELSSWPAQVMIDGALAPTDSRHDALFERYRELPGLPLPALSLPTPEE
jgi:imidazolonepropionase-like amidohydrolase